MTITYNHIYNIKIFVNPQVDISNIVTIFNQSKGFVSCKVSNYDIE